MKISRYSILSLLFLIVGCTSNLKQWTEDELSPYLAKELGEHPRFKQQPLILVGMHGEQVDAEIDDLTTNIRDQVFNRLLQTNGANLIWQSSTSALQHHTQLQDIQCNFKQNDQFYIGFDLKPINEQFQLSVKALDPKQGRWISGFGKTWQGSLSNLEQQQLKKTHPDEILRGLRPLPFTEQQMDLLANYLAKNISCLLQQSSLDKLYIYTEKNKQQALFVKKSLALVSHYLSRFNEVHIVNKPDKANIILKAQIHNIDKDLYQLWLIAQDKQADHHVKGMDTAAYVTLSKSALQMEVSKQEQKPSVVPPVIIPPPTKKPDPVIVQPTLSVDLYNTLTLISPIGEPFCRTTNPWAMGEYPIDSNHAISHCFGLKISLSQDAEVFLINENYQGQFYKLLPDNNQSRFQLFAGEQLRYPESNLFDLPVNISNEYIHVIAVNDSSVANKLHHLLHSMPVCCEASKEFDKDYWQSQLETMKNKYTKQMDWQVIKVFH